MRVELVENGPPVEVEIRDSAGVAVAGTGFVDARPVPGTHLWSLKPQSKVGAVAVPGLQVHVAPKIPIARVVFLLEHTRAGLTWRGDHVQLSQADDLLRAVVEAFEDFLCAQLGPRLAAAGGRTKTQDRWHLDVDRQVVMAPDLVWYADGPSPTAVVDAKYKAEKPDGFPDADLYQMLAYCTALRLPGGHLVYAKGNDAGRTHRVAGAGITIHAHTLDLARSPGALLAESIVRSSEHWPLSSVRGAAPPHRPSAEGSAPRGRDPSFL